jgi:integrase
LLHARNQRNSLVAVRWRYALLAWRLVSTTLAGREFMTIKARRRRFDDKAVARLKVKPKRYAKPDSELIGHFVRVHPSGVKSYVAVARDPFGRQIWTTIGTADHIGIEEARAKARSIIARVKAGKPAIEAPPPAPDSFAVVAQNWIKRHVEEEKLRTRGEIERCLHKYVLPTWGARPFAEIKRRDVAHLLDRIVDSHGARQADAVLAILSSMMRWHALRSDDYVSPIAPKMRRTKTAERARTRVFDDDELRAVWRRAEQNGAFGGLVRLLLLTAQRLSKVASMKWAEVSLDGTWHMVAEKREKGCGGDLMLPEVALEIIRAQPRIAGNPFVFAGRGDAHLLGFAKLKRDFEEGLPSMPQWGMHDMRRTARSLMSRATVNPEHAERVLGHVIGGVEGTYNRHPYTEEKADALRRLAALITEIVDGAPDDKVVSITKAHAGA